ncbi:XdhC family protein [Brucella intermedia]|uniref:XdhC family protein n=1 Tax=Brucella intermedia TaxID=94625 RepID=UPI003AB1754A
MDPLEIAHHWMNEGRDVAIATVIETWGSAPCPVGSHLVIDAAGNFEGSVSGGCVEGAVIDEALDLLRTGKAKLLEFGVADETAWRIGLSCGGRIRIHIKLIDISTLERLTAARKARKPIIHVIDLEQGKSTAVTECDGFDASLSELVINTFRSGKSGLGVADSRHYFLNAYIPPAQLIVIGAVHISQTLAQMATIAGLKVRIIDPRTAFATEERFAGTELVAEWPEETLAESPLDHYTALVAVTHDPKIDDFPIAEALRAGCFYVGALGSRKTHAARLERLKAWGLSEAHLRRIRSPIGLPIGAASPAEIAVAILAEVIQEMRSPEAVSQRGGW